MHGKALASKFQVPIGDGFPLYYIYLFIEKMARFFLFLTERRASEANTKKKKTMTETRYKHRGHSRRVWDKFFGVAY